MRYINMNNNKLTLEQRLSLLENKISNLDSMTRERERE